MSPTDNDYPLMRTKVEEVVLEIVRWRVCQYLDREQLGMRLEPRLVNHHVNLMADRLIVEVEAMLAGREEVIGWDEVKYPASWWQHFRAAWLPSWVLRRWSIRYTTVRVEKKILRVCPHVRVPQKDESHFRFLLGKP